jgi:hypothetical protein
VNPQVGSPRDLGVRHKYYDRQQKLELVLAAQKLLECGGHEVGDARSGEETALKIQAKLTSGRMIFVWGC